MSLCRCCSCNINNCLIVFAGSVYFPLFWLGPVGVLIICELCCCCSCCVVFALGLGFFFFSVFCTVLVSSGEKWLLLQYVFESSHFILRFS